MADTKPTTKKKVVVVKKKPTTGETKSYSEEDHKALMDFAKNHGDAIRAAVRQEQQKDTNAARNMEKIPINKSDFKAANHDSSMGANVFTGVSRADKDIIQSELARAIREGNGPQQYDPETSLTGRRQVENDLSYFQDVGDTSAAGTWSDFEDVWNKGIKGERLPTTKERDTMIKDFETPVAKDVYSGVVNLELHRKKEALENRKKNLEEELDENPEKTELKDEIANVEQQLQEVRRQLPAIELGAGTSRKQQFDSQLKAYQDRLLELAGEIKKNPHSERLLNESANIEANIKALQNQKNTYVPSKGQDSLITNYGHSSGKWSMTVGDLKLFMKEKGLTDYQIGEVIAQRFPTPPSDDMSITAQDVWECAHLVPSLAQTTFKNNNAAQLEVNKILERNFGSPKNVMFNYLGMHPELIEKAVPAYMAVKNIKVPGDAFAQLKKEIVNAAKEAFGAGKGRADEFNEIKHKLTSQQSLEKGTANERAERAYKPLLEPFIKEFLLNYNDSGTNAGVTPLVQGATVEEAVAKAVNVNANFVISIGNKVIKDFTLYVYGSLTNVLCAKTLKAHSQENVTIQALNAQGKEISFTAFHCSECGKYYTTADIIKKHFALLGFPLIHLEFRLSQNQRNAESEMMIYGYNVKSGGLSTYERHKILSYMLSFGLLSKAKIIATLQDHINYNGQRENMENAVEKWKSNLQFVQNFNLDEQRKIFVEKLRLKYKDKLQ